MKMSSMIFFKSNLFFILFFRSQPAKADPFADLGSLTGLKPKDNTPAPKQSMNAMQMGSQQPSNPPQAQVIFNPHAVGRDW